MTERQRWRTAAELKKAVIRHCEDKFLTFAGLTWNKEWRSSFQAEHRRRWVSDSQACPYVDAIEKALADARGFLYDEEANRDGPCAKALIAWLAQDKVSSGP